MNKELNYQRDIVMDVKYLKGGKWSQAYRITGMGVMYDAEKYMIKVYPPGKAHMIVVGSCHQEHKTPNPKGNNFFNNGYEFYIDYKDTIDQKDNCSFDIGVYEKDKGRHAWALLAIEHDVFKLSAITRCNGRVKKYNGVSVCQAKKGLIQEYEFETDVAVTQTYGCEIGNLLGNQSKSKVWRFLMPEGKCELRFVDVNNPRKMRHQAFFYGYDTIPIRGID